MDETRLSSVGFAQRTKDDRTEDVSDEKIRNGKGELCLACDLKRTGKKVGSTAWQGGAKRGIEDKP